jgi:uncharacterized protein (DUF486 family)
MISKATSILLIYIASCFYTFASFYHLKLKNWTFWKAYLIAIPVVCIEYVFNILGNKYATVNGINVIQIMMLIIGFDMINIWLINIFVLKQKTIVMWREASALLLLIGAIAISSNTLSIKMEL